MPACEDPLRPPPGLTPPETRRWLVLACELDRLHARIALRELPMAMRLPSLFERATAIAENAPGGIGKWIRGISLGAAVYRLATAALRG
jgi:hypothetical protein